MKRFLFVYVLETGKKETFVMQEKSLADASKRFFQALDDLEFHFRLLRIIEMPPQQEGADI